jgi:hypothetical protein
MRMDAVDRYSEDEIRDACVVEWQAEALAGLHWPQRGRVGFLSIPAQWTAWLLMEKAGVPRDLIAHISHTNPRDIRRRVTVAKAAMLFAHYAARVEALMRRMPRYGAAHVPATRPAKEAGCAAQHG